MTHELNYPESTKYVACYNGVDVYHFIIVHPDECLITGQPYMDTYDTEAELREAFGDLVPDPLLG